MSSVKCPAHGITSVSSCNWCGDPICEQCMVETGGRKYCARCHTKLTKNSVADTLDKKRNVLWGEKPTERITNRDPTLSEEEINHRRKLIEHKEKLDKKFFR